MAGSNEWQRKALEIYRRTFLQITDRWSQLKDLRGTCLCDELRESLFDLKQAVMDDNQEQYIRAAQEVYEISIELLQRYDAEDL